MEKIDNISVWVDGRDIIKEMAYIVGKQRERNSITKKGNDYIIG